MDPAVEKRLSALERLRARGRFGFTTAPAGDEAGAVPVRAEEPESTMADGLLETLSSPVPSSVPRITAEQLSQLLDVQPPEFDFNKVFDPGSSTLEEIDQRCRELRYRVSWLESVLTVTREELALFEEAGKSLGLSKSVDCDLPNPLFPPR